MIEGNPMETEVTTMNKEGSVQSSDSSSSESASKTEMKEESSVTLDKSRSIQSNENQLLRSVETLFSDLSDDEMTDLSPFDVDSIKSLQERSPQEGREMRKDEYFSDLLDFEPSYSPDSSESENGNDDDSYTDIGEEKPVDIHFDEQDEIQLHAGEEGEDL